MESPRVPEIFFHVGLGKTGSTYLQERFFPALKGIHYIPTLHYKKSKEIIPTLSAQKILVSREFDRQFDTEVKWFSETYPDARMIIFLRRHDSWIASQYRRFVKNGLPLSFTQFMDVEHNKGYWDKKELDFHAKLMFAEKHLTQKPLVLFYEDFKKDSLSVLDRMTEWMGASYDKATLNTAVKHASYNEKQLKIMRRVGRLVLNPTPKPIKNKVLRFLRRLWYMSWRYTILYSSLLVPGFMVSKKPLIASTELEKVREFMQTDWERCREYAEKINTA
jgi:hypothetical protein